MKNTAKTKAIELEKLLPRLKEISRQYPEVAAAYLFGSYASGDIDIGIIMAQELPEMESFRIEMSLAGEMEKIFQTDNIDLVVLNKAPLPIQYNATCGKLLFSNDEEKRSDFVEYARNSTSIACLSIANTVRSR